jgi:hypothetical protein
MRMMCAYRGVKLNDVQYSDPQVWFQADKPALLAANGYANLP